MTTPSGTIAASNINTELGRGATVTFSMNDAGVRALAGQPSGTIAFSNLRGKSSLTFSPPVGTYQSTNYGYAEIIINCTQPAAWQWSPTGGTTGIMQVYPPNNGPLTTDFIGGLQARTYRPPNQQPSPDDPLQSGYVTYVVYATVAGTQYGPWYLQLSAIGDDG
jgi:hypothetical protein